MTELDINTTTGGFYNGFAMAVAVPAKIIISIVVVWAIFWPVRSGEVLNGFNGFILQNFATWYIWVVAFFVIVCLVLALWPAAGRLNLGVEGEKPEFSKFSWFAMMFGAGIGVGMLTYSVAEPVSHFASNPETIMGLQPVGPQTTCVWPINGRSCTGALAPGPVTQFAGCRWRISAIVAVCR